MPTGYTAKLIDSKFDVKKWLIEDVSRAFGFCIDLRDMSSNMSEKQIKEVLTKSSDFYYHKEELRVAEKRLKKLQNLKKKTLEKEMQAEYDSNIKQYNKMVDEKNALKNNLIKAKEQCAKLLESAETQTVRNVLVFAIEQIEDTIGFDCDLSYSVRPRKLPLDTWLKQKTDSIKSDIEYHTEEMQKAQRRTEENVTCFNNFSNFIKKYLQ